MGAQSVGYLEAWGLWWQGVDLKPMSLHGVPMIWIGRGAKVATFVAGLVVVLDILGPDRVKERASKYFSDLVAKNRHNRLNSKETAAMFLFFSSIFSAGIGSSLALWSLILSNGISLVSAVLVPPLGLVILLCVFAALGMLMFLYEALLGRLDSDSDQRVVRWISFSVIVVGFHFDLLAS